MGMFSTGATGAAGAKGAEAMTPVTFSADTAVFANSLITSPPQLNALFFTTADPNELVYLKG